MKLVCISDLHGHKPSLPPGDLLIIAGDLTAQDTEEEHEQFVEWATMQMFENIVIVAGNHDGYLKKFPLFLGDRDQVHYLCDSGCEIEGFKIWGSPWTPEYYNWDFMLPRGEALKEKWALIPADTNILVTHCPPKGILDHRTRGGKLNNTDCGCEELLVRVSRLQPLLHVFGHIHEGHGSQSIKWESGKFTNFFNCSIMDKKCLPKNKPMEIEL